MRFGSYEVESCIATGESSTVYRATGPLGTVAVKVLHPNYATDPVVAERFIAYAQTLSAVSDPGVVRIFDIIREEHESQPIVGIVMEHLTGGSFAERQDLDTGSVLKALLRTLSTLHAAGIVHRDIRPSHIVFGADERPRLVDFTGASVRDLAGLSRSTVHTARREYADPYAWGHGVASPSQDLYSIGAVIGERVSGDSFLASVVRAMTGAPHERPRSADEALGWLEAGAGILGNRVTECLYCGTILPVDAVMCLECGREPPIIRHDPNGEFIALRKVSEEQSVLGPFLRTLKLLSVDPDPHFHLILGDSRMYSREERRRGYEMPVRIADSIALESVAPLIALLTSPAPDRIHIERYPMSRLKKVKRGPLITLAYRDASAPVGVEALRRASARYQSAGRTYAGSGGAADGLRSQFLHAVGVAAGRMGDIDPSRLDLLIDRFERLFDRYEAVRVSVESSDLHAAYADIERQSLSGSAPSATSRAVFAEHAKALSRLAAIESAISRAGLALRGMTRDTAAAVLSKVADLLTRATAEGADGGGAHSGSVGASRGSGIK